MSVNKKKYVILGVKMSFSAYEEMFDRDEDPFVHEDFYEAKEGGLIVVLDGMNTEYVVMGRLIKMSDVNGEFPMTIISNSIFDKDGLLEEMVDVFKFKPEEVNLQVIIFEHYC